MAADGEIAIERTRERLDALVSEIDRRRRAITDVRFQLRKHTWVVPTLALTMVAGITTAVLLGMRSRRRAQYGRTLRGRAGRLRLAFKRMAAEPDRVATSEPNVLKKIAAAAGTAFASKVAKSAADRAIQAATGR